MKIHLESVEGLELVKVCRSGGKTKSEVNAKAENGKTSSENWKYVRAAGAFLWNLSKQQYKRAGAA